MPLVEHRYMVWRRLYRQALTVGGHRHSALHYPEQLPPDRDCGLWVLKMTDLVQNGQRTGGANDLRLSQERRRGARLCYACCLQRCLVVLWAANESGSAK
jgi:hypothetical protein